MSLTGIPNLSLPAKLVKGQDFITMGTDSANVPGNAPLIAELQARQTALAAANATYEEARRR